MKPRASPIPARLNPFAAHRVERIPYRFAEGDWSSNLARLAQLGFRAAIVGPHGTGKTTLLEQLSVRLREMPAARPDVRYLFFGREPALIAAQVGELCPRTSRDQCWLLDGFERLESRQRLKVIRAAQGGLVVTSHRPGRLTTWIRTQSSRTTLDYLLAQLALEANPTLRRLADEAYVATQGNLRDALRLLFDRAGELPGQGLGPSGRISSLALPSALSSAVPANQAGIGCLPGG